MCVLFLCVLALVSVFMQIRVFTRIDADRYAVQFRFLAFRVSERERERARRMTKMNVNLYLSYAAGSFQHFRFVEDHNV